MGMGMGMGGRREREKTGEMWNQRRAQRRWQSKPRTWPPRISPSTTPHAKTNTKMDYSGSSHFVMDIAEIRHLKARKWKDGKFMIGKIQREARGGILQCC